MLARLKSRMMIGLCICLLGMGYLVSGSYIQLKALLAQHLLLSAWQQTLQGKAKVKPWAWADTWPLARLRVNEQQADLIVLEGATGRTLAFAPGHMQGTPAPGERGFSVISAHRDTHFAFLQHLQTGDTMELQTRHGQQLRYRVTATQIVNAHAAMLPDDHSIRGIMLVTCYPFDSLRAGGELRYVVYAQEELDKKQATVEQDT